ncbi:MAG: efflux RND transporter periplasmic adaptor subunit [Polyangiaceae bacterium]
MLLLTIGCSKEAGSGGGKKGGSKGEIAFPVQVGAVAARQVEYVVAATGSIDAFEQVAITSRVTGVVESVRFKEGDRVDKGAVLVEIEPRRFQLAVAQAQAQLDRAIASKNDATAFLARREQMSAEGVVSADELQSWRTKLATAKADEAAAKAALGLAQLNVRDAYVRAPIGGTVQTRTVQTGQYAQPGMALATILRMDPMLLRFEIPEADAGRVRTGMIARFTAPSVQGALEAKITHVAASASSVSRMVAVVAEVESPPESLRPGAFAEVTVPIGTTAEAPVIPETAIRPSDKGFLAYVVQDGKAQMRVLKLGMRTDDGLVEVRSGLRPGESLVVRGSEALSDGAKVRIDDKVPAAEVSAGPQAPGAPAPTGEASAQPAAPPPAAAPNSASGGENGPGAPPPNRSGSSP